MTRPAGEEGATDRRPSEPSKPEVLPATPLCMRGVNTSEGGQAVQPFKTVDDVLRACLARIEARKARNGR